jgi:hypothetical protein
MRTAAAAVIASLVSFAAAGSVYAAPEQNNTPAYGAPTQAAYAVDNDYNEGDNKKDNNGWQKAAAAPAYTQAPSYSAAANQGWESKTKSEENNKTGWENKSESDKKNDWEHKTSTSTSTGWEDNDYKTNEWDHKDYKTNEWDHKDSKTNEWEHKTESKTNEWEHKTESKTTEWEHKTETKTKTNEWEQKAESKTEYPKTWEKATTTTKIVSQYTTYCPEPTVVTVNEKQYTVTKATTLTITDCPCTIVEPCPTETAYVPPPHSEPVYHGETRAAVSPHSEPTYAPHSEPAYPPHSETEAFPAPTGYPKPPPVIVSGASSSFVHVGAAVFGAVIVGVLAL